MSIDNPVRPYDYESGQIAAAEEIDLDLDTIYAKVVEIIQYLKNAEGDTASIAERLATVLEPDGNLASSITADIASRSIRDGDAYSGTHDFTGASVKVPEAPSSSNSPASKAYADNLAFESAGLPDQTGNSGKFLQTVSGLARWSTVYETTITYQEFTSSGTWTKPDGFLFGFVEVVGGGGSGAVGGADYKPMGGGGGGYADAILLDSDITGTVDVIVGAGGLAESITVSSDSDGYAGNSGGDSSFGSYVVGKGGEYGWTPSGSRAMSGSGAKNGESNYAGGAGGALSVSTYGGISAVGGSAVKGGAGGGSGGLPGGTSVFGGNGGGSRYQSAPGTADSGEAPGGGGGACSITPGGTGTLTSGAGADGIVRVWSVCEVART